MMAKNKIAKMEKVIKLKKKQSEDFNIEATAVWAKWCHIHRGHPPIGDERGFKCQKCGNLVCCMDFYVTSKGCRCGKCLNDIPKDEFKKLKPFYTPSVKK